MIQVPPMLIEASMTEVLGVTLCGCTKLSRPGVRGHERSTR